MENPDLRLVRLVQRLDDERAARIRAERAARALKVQLQRAHKQIATQRAAGQHCQPPISGSG